MRLSRWIAALPARLRTIVRRSQAEQDLDDEIAFHLAMDARTGRHGDEDGIEAARRPRLGLGGVAQVHERCRDAWPLRWATDLRQDLGYTCRHLRRTPVFTLTAVTVLALGIGATVAIFSVVSAVLLRPLPYPHAGRLVRIWTAMPARGYPRSGSSLPDYRTWRADSRSFDGMAASHATTYNLTGTDNPALVSGARMTAGMWDLLGPTALVGRTFTAPEEAWGHHRVVVLSERLWRRRFGSDPSILGRPITLDDRPFVVIGIVQASFHYPDDQTEIWTPLSFAPGDDMATRSNHFIDIIGRVKHDTSVAEAQADLSVIADRMRQQVPENAGLDVTVQDWQASIVGDVRPTLLLLAGAVGLLWLIACTNVATLVLARAIGRRRELTVRAAIGAGRGRLTRQLLAENLLLSALGAAAGVTLAYGSVGLLPTLGPIGLPRLGEVAVDGVTLVMAAGLSLLTALACGIWPLRQMRDIEIASAMKDSTRSAGGSLRQVRGRRVLLTAQVSLSLVLLVGAGLLIASLVRLLGVDPGFRPDTVMTARVNLPANRYDASRRLDFVAQITEQVSALPGVQAAAAGTRRAVRRHRLG